MSTPVLVTKLFLPPTRPKAVPRPRLLARLDDGLRRKLTLVSAPAGFGKTTLVGAWVAGCGRWVAWLSLDGRDGDPVRFLTYLVAALQQSGANVGSGLLDALQSPQPPPTEALLTILLNEIAALSDEIVLVLDDYHALDARRVDAVLAFLVEHLPPQLHLVIVTREDPPLPLVRLRVRGQLTELRAADLRFTPDEAAEFLNAAMGLDLTAADIAALEDRTEGWIAGLQLAALSLQGRADATGFIRSFAGDDRHIVDYLVEEVLQRQPPDVRDFLLHTAILERLSGPLCDAVTGQVGGIARLEALERGNLFLVPLDDRRHWYRYQHLFADVLRAHLIAEQSERVPDLHRRASAWYERRGESPEAIRHALAAGDFPRAAELIEHALPALRRERLGTTLLGWLKAFPDEVIGCRPVLSVAYAWALLAGDEFAGVEARLRDAERWLDTTADGRERPGVPAAEMVIVVDAEYRGLPATIAIYRAALAQAQGDLPAAVTYAWRVLELAPEDDYPRRGAAEGFLGLASWANGDLDAAYRTYAAGMASLERAGHRSDAITGALVLAELRVAQGRLRDAERTLEQAVQRATEQGVQGLPDFLVGLSELRRERNDLHAATQLLLRSQELATGTGAAPDRSRWCVAMARIKEAQGDPDGALALLDEAERLYVGYFFPDVRPVAALKARVWIAQGRLGEALGWVRGRGLSAEDDLAYLREFEHITLSRVMLARHSSNRAHPPVSEALGLLDRLLRAAEAGGRAGSILAILVLQALAHQAHGAIPAALVPLERALALAEPERYVRIFVDEGPPMEDLLAAAVKQGIAPDYVGRLLAAFGKVADSTPPKQGIIEPLSDRELDVLRLLGTDLDGPAIARELMVSLNTMRTHTKNIFGKLGVNNRRSAVRRAEELALLSRTRKH